jgi:hypothetical protein
MLVYLGALLAMLYASLSNTNSIILRSGEFPGREGVELHGSCKSLLEYDAARSTVKNQLNRMRIGLGTAMRPQAYDSPSSIYEPTNHMK